MKIPVKKKWRSFAGGLCRLTGGTAAEWRNLRTKASLNMWRHEMLDYHHSIPQPSAFLNSRNAQRGDTTFSDKHIIFYDYLPTDPLLKGLDLRLTSSCSHYSTNSGKLCSLQPLTFNRWPNEWDFSHHLIYIQKQLNIVMRWCNSEQLCQGVIILL